MHRFQTRTDLVASSAQTPEEMEEITKQIEVLQEKISALWQKYHTAGTTADQRRWLQVEIDLLWQELDRLEEEKKSG